MFTLILTVAMTQTAPAPKAVALFQPCVWPNKCVTQPVAQFQPCVWPNKCATPVAQVQTCVWPHKCATPKS